MRGDAAHGLTQVRGGDGEDHEIRGIRQRRDIGRGAEVRRQVHARQARLVPPGLGDACRRPRGVAQERDGLPLGHDRGEGGAPGAAADDGDAGGPRARAAGLPCPAHQARRFLGARLPVSLARICSRNTSRIGRAGEVVRVAQPVLQVPAVAEVDRCRIGGKEHERRRRHAGLGRVADLGAAPADQGRRGALHRGRHEPVQLPGGDPLAPLAPHVDGQLQDLAHPLPGLGADGHDRCVVQERELAAQVDHELVEGLVGLVLDDVPLVDRDDQAPALLHHVPGDMGILRGEPVRGVQHEDRDVRPGDGLERPQRGVALRGGPGGDLAALADAGGVDEHDLAAAPRDGGVDGVPRRPRGGRDDRPGLAQQRVEQAALAHVRATDERDGGRLVVVGGHRSVPPGGDVVDGARLAGVTGPTVLVVSLVVSLVVLVRGGPWAPDHVRGRARASHLLRPRLGFLLAGLARDLGLALGG